MRYQRLLIFFALPVLIYGTGLNAQISTGVFENGDDKLVVYSDVPGLAQPGEYYKIRVRSNASNNEWQECFGLVTRSLYEYSNENYFSILKGWTHTYANIEMNSPVEVEIAKADGSPITKAAVHPHAKGSAVTITDGKAYFSMDKPALIAVDIDGQMDDHDTGRDQFAQAYDGPAIHAVSIFAHPLFEKPDSTSAGVKVVHPGEDPPTDPGTFNTIYFAPGVHNIGKDYQIHKNREYYIPGDAIVYGTMGNHEGDDGMNIHIYGVGTISGDSLKHPEFDPDFPGYPTADASPSTGRPWKPISIIDAEYTLVEGVCLANPAFHALALSTNINNKKVTTVRWAKVISWRGNGDGIGNAHIVEDCFLRTQDDATYVKGDRRRCVIWNDANGAAFVMSSIPDDFPILVEDCDVIYSRASWHLWSGGRVFSGRPINGVGKKQVNVLFRDIRIEDKRPTLQIFYVLSKNDISTSYLGNPNGDIGSSWSGIKFQNITAEGKSVVGHPEIFHGCAESPYSDWTFDSVMIDGKLLTSLDDFAEVNEFVTDITFNPGIEDDASLFDIRVDGVSLPEFRPAIEQYSVNLQLSTFDAPVISATQMDYGATVSVVQAESVPGTAIIRVTAEDGIITKTYSINFFFEGIDELISLDAPEEFSPGDTIIVSVRYTATTSRDIWVLLKDESDNNTKYGESRVTVPMGARTEDVELIVSENAPLAMDAYKIAVNLLPVGASFAEVLDIKKVTALDVVSPYSSNATLADLSINGVRVPDFAPGKIVYDIILPAGTVEVPDVTAEVADITALAEVRDAAEIPGSTIIVVTAEDSLTSLTYTLNFSLESLSSLKAPDQVMGGETVSIPVSYAAAMNRDILVFIQQNISPWNNYGESLVSAPEGLGTITVDLKIDASIPVATNGYSIIAALIPEGGDGSERLVEITHANVDAIIPTNISDLISGREDDSGIFVFPNPFSSEIHILNSSKKDFSIYSIEGRKIFDSRAESASGMLVKKTQNWQNGIYVLVSEYGKVYKLVKY